LLTDSSELPIKLALAPNAPVATKLLRLWRRPTEVEPGSTKGGRVFHGVFLKTGPRELLLHLAEARLSHPKAGSRFQTYLALRLSLSASLRNLILADSGVVFSVALSLSF